MRPLFPCLFALAFLSLFPPVLAADAPKDLHIVRITPEGQDVPATRQIVVEFNRAVVPVGDMARNAEDLGITITPPVKCQWRWLNTSALSCNLSDQDALTPATTYKLHIDPKIAAEDGAMVDAAVNHEFTTQRPRAQESNILVWKYPGVPSLRVNFNQPVTKNSIAAHLYFEDAQNKNRTAVTVSSDETDDRSPTILENGEEARNLWIVTPNAPLPLNTKIVLKQEAGLVSAQGTETGTDTTDIQQFYTFPAFAFRGIVCYSAKGEEVTLTPGTPQTDDSLCDPMRPISLSFSAPVMRSQIKDNLVLTPSLSANPGFDPWGDENRDWSRLWDPRSEQNADYRVGFPVGLKAAQNYTLSIPTQKLSWWEKFKNFVLNRHPEPTTKLADEFGRPLAPFSFSFATGHRNPNFVLPYRDAVLEKNVDTDVPLYVNNLENFSFKYNATNGNGATDFTTFPKVVDKQYAVPAGVRAMLGGKSGAVYATLQTTPEIPNMWEGGKRLFAQVTPYNVYAKFGHFASLVWVTDLATGKPVKDADVSVLVGQLAHPAIKTKPLATIKTDEQGMATLPGTQDFDPDQSFARAWKDTDNRLFIRVTKGNDMGLLPLGYDYAVQLWDIATDVYVDNTQKYGHMKAWGMTAQGIYRAGDTIQYKLFVRNQDNNKFIAPPAGKYGLEITDPAGKSVDQKDVTLSPFGTVDGEYTVPENASVGWYAFKLTATFKENPTDITREFYPLNVLVSDFTPAPFRVTTDLNGDAFGAGDTLDITARALLHSGGPFGGSSLRDTITLRSRPFSSRNPAAKDFTFDSNMEEQRTIDLSQQDGKLDDVGEWKSSFTLPQTPIVFGQIIVENAVRDDRGKSIASESRADYAGVDRLVGLHPTQWVFTAKKPAVVQTIVVDTKGAPVSGVPVTMTIEKQNVVTAKVKSAGSAYLNDNTVEWTKFSDCAVASAAEGQDCTFTPDSAGLYRVTAAIKDTKGRAHESKQELYVSGAGYVQWNEDRAYALSILPESNDYKVGETARYLVKNPHPGATALVTVERYGVLDSFVQTLDGSAPVIEIPVKPDYAPGFYVSVTLVSPRADAPPPEMGQIDLGKPAFRAGYVKTGVIDPYKEMTVAAKADQDVYRPRDTVSVTLNAKPLHPAKENEPVELAVAVLDESVFDLIQSGRNAFDPYHGFYDLDSLDVTNYSLLTRLIGRQKFEKKGANPGGDGGVDVSMRNLFKYVSYWNPSVPVDENGNAKISFEAPDNLTGWRILALAVTKDDRMGLGDANFKVNRPTELRPVMPNQVREGDNFVAGFSVMNRTDHKRDITVSIDAKGTLKEGAKTHHEETVTLEPYKRANVSMPLDAALLSVSRDMGTGEISFTVAAGDDEDKDGMEHTLPVLKSRTTETSANYGSTTDAAVTESIAVPKDIYTDTGDLSVTFSPSILANLDGAFTYMRDYPYPCWEQKLTMGVMAAQYQRLKPYLDEKTTWDNADKLPDDILAAASSYQAPNGGMAYFTAKDDYADPYLSAYTALAFRWLTTQGYKVPADVESNLKKYLLAFLRNNTAPDYYQDGMTSTVRAAILAAYAGTNDITKNDVLRFKPFVKNMSLFGKALYLQSASSFEDTKSIARDVAGMILSSGVESGGKLSFNQTYDDGWERILSTPMRDNCTALDALMSYPDQTIVGDKAEKIVRYITQSRGNRDHWENTQENVFCMNALANYAKRYESTTPSMKIVAAYAGQSMGDAAFQSLTDQPVTLSHALMPTDEGKKETLSLEKSGDGRVYYATRLTYAVKNPPGDVNAGMEIHREYALRGLDGKWAVSTPPVTIKRGDLVRVDLYLSIPTARNFVVVDDPLPGGLETVNTDLATASSVDAQNANSDFAGGSYWFKFNDWHEFNASRWNFYHRELRHDAARFYADWLPPGNYHLSYMAQAIADGIYTAPPVKAQEMYDADIYGLGAKGELVVRETP